ncbi:hypothetical protein WA556_005903 [Blastocystis sp. ATCC 50177/Nand II]
MESEQFDLESSGDKYAALKDDIQRLFKSYQSLLDSMETISASSSNRMYRSIVDRQKDVKRELQNDYKRITNHIQQKENRFLLLHSGGIHNSSDDDDEMKDLIKERSAVRSALHMADEYIGQAASSHQSLLDQRRRLANSQHRILSIVNRIPGVNSLMRNIQNKKGKDNVIVAVVIALCVCFILWYAFH